MARRFALVERDDETESSSSSSSSEEDEEEDAGVPEAVPATSAGTAAAAKTQAARKLKIKFASSDLPRCKVCGSLDHQAGFVGATYIDCPEKPCYLCKKAGHTTATCPFRLAPGHGCTPTASSSRSSSLMTALRDRETGRGTRSPGKEGTPTTPAYQVDAAIYKLHSRRCCTLEFHQSRDNLVVSGDKKGGIAVWDFDKVHERTLYKDVHPCLCNQIKMVPWHDSMSCCTASSDGTVKLLDLEVGSFRKLLDLNPQGWTRGGPWTMIYGCAADVRAGVVYAGDSAGMLHVIDLRAPMGSQLTVQAHKKDKITTVDVHPLDSNLLLTGGNDRTAKLFDVRAFSSNNPSEQPSSSHSLDAKTTSPTQGSKARGAAAQTTEARGQLACMVHARVVNAASFSPQTGQKIMTTCQDNRIRVWDRLLDVCGPPSREIVHSHDFNRYLTPFKAEWDPKDVAEKRFVVGRYISEDFNGVALHPIDIIDASSGRLLRELVDSNLTTITPVNKMHPRRDVIVSGSSRSLYLWAPASADEEPEGVKAASSKAGSSSAAPQPLVKASSRFTSFDAEPGEGKKAAAGGAKRKGAPSTKTCPGGDSDDD